MADKCGTVYLTGSGPGDPGLITVRALELIKLADAVVYDKLVPVELLRHARGDAELIFVGKEAGKHSMPQDKINALLVKLAKEGKDIVRLKGGDPLVFGRGGEEALELFEAGVKFEFVPGVTAGTAVLCYAGIPLTQRGVATSYHMITGQEDPGKPESQLNFEALAKVEGTLVFFMGVRNLPIICDLLISNGKAPKTPSAIIHRGCTPFQKTITGTLETISGKAAEAGIKPPSIIVIGEVCNFRDSLNWFETRPLMGKSVVVTRSRRQVSGIADKLTNLGAEVVEIPTITIEPSELTDTEYGYLKNIAKYDWVFITSQNGIPPFFESLEKLGMDARSISGVKVGVIGQVTANVLKGHGIIADLIPEAYTTRGLLESFSALHDSEKGSKALLPRADIASRELPDGLITMGISCDEIAIYKTTPAKVDKNLLKRLSEGIDYITFASSSTVQNLFNVTGKKQFLELSDESRFISIGPVTSEKIKSLGATVAREAKQSTIEGLISVILENAECTK